MLGRLGKRVKSLDEFKERFQMKITEDSDTVSSNVGLALTVILSVVLLMYAQTKYTAWDNRSNVEIISSTIEHAFD